MVDVPILAIDLGTTKICALVALMHKDHENKIEVLGMATGISSGIRGGTVSDLEEQNQKYKKLWMKF